MPPQTISSNSTRCYNEDGTISNDIFCGFSSIGSCCGDGWDCLSNGLCRDHGTTAYSQATCTDPTFSSDNCLAFCNKSVFGGFTEVSQCGDNSWCCAGIPGQTGTADGDCCTENPTSLQPFPFSVVLREHGRGSLPATESATPSTSISSTSRPSTTTATNSKPSTPSSSSGVPRSTNSTPTKSTSTQPFSTAARASAPTQTTPTPPPSTPASSNQATKIGIAIAVPLGVIILAALTYLYLQNRKTRKALEHMRAQEAAKNPTDSADGESPLPEQENNQGVVGELDGVRNFELSNEDRERHELGGMARYEMTERFSRYEMR